MAEKILTSESVTEGHPDKVCDLIADSVLDAYIELDPRSHVACEVLCKSGVVVLAGIVMLVLPGPGLLTIAAGLALLALEFEAARDLRDQLAGWVRARVLREEAKARAKGRAAH